MSNPAHLAWRNRPGRHLRVVLLLLALTGLVTNGVLVLMSVPLVETVAQFGSSLCTPGQHVDCDYVLGSRWSKVAGIPVAFFGAAYCAALAAWFIFIGVPNHEGRRWHAVPLLLTAAGLCASLWFMYVMAAKMPVWCTWCVAAHVINGLLFLCSVLARPRPRSIVPAADQRTNDTAVPTALSAATARPSNLMACVVLGGSVAAILVAFLMVFLFVSASNNKKHALRFQGLYVEATNNIEYVVWRHSLEPAHEIPQRPTDETVGRSEAPFKLAVSSDFECRKRWEFLRQAAKLVSQFPPLLRCVFRHYPMCTQCNPHIERSPYYFSCEAAFAAAAAGEVGSEVQMREYCRMLYENHARFDRDVYATLARQTGIDAKRFSAALAAPQTRQHVVDDITLGHDLGVEGTPAMFLNGHRLSTWRILKEDSGKLDVEKTLALWERLLGATAVVNREAAVPTGD